MPDRRKLQEAVTLLVLISVGVPQRLTAQCDSGTVCSDADCPRVERTYCQGRWFVSETANFQVCCEGSDTPAVNLARSAEALRGELHAKWLGDEPSDVWTPRCQIILHSSRSSYIGAVGRGGERTVGSSLVKLDKGRITYRRIDLVGGTADCLSSALPHELTHVVLRDRFPTTVVPRWADEGIAILADTDAKQTRHLKDLREAIARRTTFRAAELFVMDGYPSPSRVGAFYGQCASLTQFLVARESPEQFVEFVDRACKNGYDAALQECYEIPNVAELDRQWRQQGRFPLESYGEQAQSRPRLFRVDGTAVPLASPLPSSSSTSN